MGGLSARINNYDPFGKQPVVCGRDGLPSDCGPAFGALIKNDSYVRYTPPSDLSSIGELDARFTTSFGWNNPFLFLMNDMSMASGRASIEDQRGVITLSMPFESDGREIVAACHNDIRCGLGPPEGNNKPGAEINNLVIRTPFSMWADRRGTATRIRAGIGNSTFTADIERAGVCKDNALAVFCDMFAGDIESKVRGNLAESINSFVVSSSGLSTKLDLIVDASVCRIAETHGKDCRDILVLMLDDAGTLRMIF